MDKDEKMDKVLGLKGKCSSYYLSKITGIPTSMCSKIIAGKEVPEKIIGTVIKHMTEINSYKDFDNEAYDWYTNTFSDKYLKENDISIGSLSINLMLSSDDVNKYLSKDKQVRPSEYQVLYDFCTWMINNKNNIHEEVNNTEDIKEDHPSANTPCELGVDNDSVIKSMQEQIDALNRQIDWYEQIIDTFTKLANAK